MAIGVIIPPWLTSEREDSFDANLPCLQNLSAVPQHWRDLLVEV